MDLLFVVRQFSFMELKMLMQFHVKAEQWINHSESNVLKFTQAVGVQMLEEQWNHSELSMCEVVKNTHLNRFPVNQLNGKWKRRHFWGFSIIQQKWMKKRVFMVQASNLHSINMIYNIYNFILHNNLLKWENIYTCVLYVLYFFKSTGRKLALGSAIISQCDNIKLRLNICLTKALPQQRSVHPVIRRSNC